MLSGQCNIADPEQGLLITKANFLCGDVINNFEGTLPPVNSPIIGQPASLCEGYPGGGGEPDNVLWFSFIATSFTLDIDIFYDNCGFDPNAGVQVGIYGDPEFNEKLACNSFPASSPANLSSNSAEIGKVYYLYIDGYESATCDFEIVVNSGVSNTPYSFDWVDDISAISAIEDDLLIQDNHNVCSGNNISYFYTAPSCEAQIGALTLDSFALLDLYCYEWTITPAGGGVILGDQNAREIEIDWQTPGDYTLSVDIFPSPSIDACSPDLCVDADPISVSAVGVTAMVATDTIFFCADDPVTYCGEVITESTTRTCIDDPSNCFETEQVFELLAYDTIDYGTFVNCGSSGCFELFGIPYCTPMEYVRPDPSSCNVYHRFTVEGFNIEIDLPTTMSLDCANDDVEISPIITTNYTGNVLVEWFNGGVLVGSDPTFPVSATGVYDVSVSFPDLDSSCTGEAQIEIVETIDAPAFSLLNPVLTCANPNGLVEFVEIDAVSSILWEGPNGFSSTDPSFTTNESGNYKLSIVGANGCLTDTSFVVTEDMESPLVELTYEDLNCVVSSTNATLDTDASISIVHWEIPNGDIINEDSLLITSPGDHLVTIVATNGCSTIVPFTVLENLDMPTADAGVDQMWQCNTQELTLEGTISPGPNDVEWSVVEKGDIRSDINLSKINVGSEGTYILNVLNRDSGCETSDSVTVFRNEDVPDTMETAIVDPSCFKTADGMIQVIYVEGGTEPYRYFLNGIQSSDDFMDDLTAGVYKLLVLDSFDCRLEIDVDVEEQPEIVLNMPSSVTIGFNERFTFWALHNLLPNDVQAINWYNANNALIGEGDSLIFQTTEDTEISLEVFNQNGCSTLRSIPIEVDFDLPVFAPTVFSPNEDGFNDWFTLYKNNDYPSSILSMSIYNRWGEQVFFRENISFEDDTAGWDGRRNGQLQNSGVFTYSALIELVDGSTKLVIGDVTLIR